MTTAQKTVMARKISLGSINGVSKGFRGITERTFVGRIMGIVSKCEVGEHATNGPYVKFKGEFQAFDRENTRHVGPVCFLPEPSASMMHEAWENANGENIQFAFDYFVVPNESVAIGYNYETVPLFEVKTSDPLALLANSVTMALPAPAKLPIEQAAEKPGEAPEADAPKAAKGKKSA